MDNDNVIMMITCTCTLNHLQQAFKHFVASIKQMTRLKSQSQRRMELRSRVTSSLSTSPILSIAPGVDQFLRLSPFPCLSRRQQGDRQGWERVQDRGLQSSGKGSPMWKEISHLSFRLMAATMSAVQPSLCLALTSAPSDNSLERDKYFQCMAYHGHKSGRNEKSINREAR